MTARARKATAHAAGPLQLFTVVRADAPTVPARGAFGMVPTFTSAALAQDWIGESAGWLVVPLIAVMPAPSRETVWGPGQFDDLPLGEDGKVSLRITDDGHVHMLIPGGDHDITEISASLGTGLHEAGARAAQIRSRLAERGRPRATRKAGGEAGRVAHLPRRSRR